MSSLKARLPDELLACCGAFLDKPSAGRFAQASRSGQRLVLKRLNAEKAALVAAASQTVAVAAPQHIALTAASKVFIDTFAAAYVGASLAARKMLVEYIIAAASGDETLGSTTWTASTVHARLKRCVSIQRH